jgi:hypothetical protein
LAVLGERVRWDARDEAGLEELRMRPLVGRIGRDVDRDVPDQLHPTVSGITAKLGPFAVEAHLIVQRLLAREGDPVLDPVRRTRTERGPFGVRDRGVGRAQQQRRSGER